MNRVGTDGVLELLLKDGQDHLYDIVVHRVFLPTENLKLMIDITNRKYTTISQYIKHVFDQLIDLGRFEALIGQTPEKRGTYIGGIDIISSFHERSFHC